MADEASIVLEAPGERPAPRRIQRIILRESKLAGIPPPESITVKDVDIEGWMGGFTSYKDERHDVPGYIGIVYGTGKWRNSDQEMLAVLHETAHWLTKRPWNIADDLWPMEFDSGHDAVFYMQLTVLCLKYGVDIHEACVVESNYMGNRVYAGMQLYEETYNG